LQLWDLIKFFLILLTFLIGFGVALQALLKPRDYFTFSLLWKISVEILDIAYWPIYGEIKILDDLTKNINAYDGLSVTRYVLSYIILIIYVALVSILLMNILIAIFKYNLKNASKFK
jgi:hypothetical protein